MLSSLKCTSSITWATNKMKASWNEILVLGQRLPYINVCKETKNTPMFNMKQVIPTWWWWPEAQCRTAWNIPTQLNTNKIVQLIMRSLVFKVSLLLIFFIPFFYPSDESMCSGLCPLLYCAALSIMLSNWRYYLTNVCTMKLFYFK